MNTVCFNVFKKQPNQKEQRMVVVQATAVGLQDDIEILLEFGEECGIDIDSAKVTDGSDLADALKARIKEYADRREWKVMPGIINY